MVRRSSLKRLIVVVEITLANLHIISYVVWGALGKISEDIAQKCAARKLQSKYSKFGRKTSLSSDHLFSSIPSVSLCP